MNQITPMIDNSGTEYDIPKNEVKEFQADMGTGAQRQYLYRTEDGTDYAIPESESKDFLADFPNAQPVRRFQFADGTTEDVPANELKSFFDRYETDDKYKPDRDIRDAKKAELEAKFKKINAEADSPLWAGIKEGFASFGRYLWNPAQEYRERFGEDNIGTQMFTGADDAANAIFAGVVKIPSGIEKVFGYGLGGRSTKVGNYFINDAQGFEAAVDRTLPQNKKAEFMDGEALEWANRVQNMSSTLFNFTLAGGAGAAGAPTIVAIDSTDQYIDNYDRAIARGAKPEEANAIATEAFMWNAILEGTLINGGIKPMHKGAQKLAATPTLDLTKPTFSGITRGLTVGTLRNYAAKTTGHILSTGAIMGTDAMGKELLRQDAEGEERNWTKVWEAGKGGGEEGALMGLMFGTASGLTAASEFRMYHKAMKKTFGDLAMKNIGTAQGREMMSKVNPKGTYDFLKAREDGGTPSRKQADRMILPDDLSAAERAKIADDFLHDGITPESIKAEMEAKKPGPKPTDIETEVVEPKKTALPGPETGAEPPAEAPKGAETPESGAVAPVGASEVARVGETTPEAPKAVEAVSGASAEGAAAAGAAKPGVQPAETPPETPPEAPAEAPAEAHAPVLSGDEVRKTMPGYDPKNWKTHVDKSGYVAPRMEKQFQELLSTRKGKGNGEVIFLAGGNGSGKSTLVSGLGNTPDFIVDSTLGNLKTAKKQIDAVLANGQKPVIDYVYRAPEEALEGVVERVENGGHVVSPLSFADSHTKGIKNLRLLADEYGDKISVHVIDNSAEGSPEITLEQLEAKGVPDHAEIRKRANEVLGQYGTLVGDGGSKGSAGGGGEVKGAEAQKGDGEARTDRDQGRADGREAQGEGGGADKGAVAVDRTGVPDWLDDDGVAEIFKAGNFIDGWGSAVSAFFRHRVRTDEKLAELRRQYAAETDEAKRKKLNNQYKKRVNELWEHQGEVQPQDEMRDAVNAIMDREGSVASQNLSKKDKALKAWNRRYEDVKKLTGAVFDETALSNDDLMKFRKLHENYAKGEEGAADALKKFVAEKAPQKNPETPDKPTTPETAPAAEAEKPVGAAATEAPKAEVAERPKGDMKSAVRALAKLRDERWRMNAVSFTGEDAEARRAEHEAQKAELDKKIEAAVEDVERLREPSKPIAPAENLKPNPKKAAKVVEEFAAKDQTRKALTKVYHDKKDHVAVATNGRMIIVTKHGYDPDAKDDPENPYPNWRMVIPKADDMTVRIEVNPTELVKTCKDAMRLTRAVGIKPNDGPQSVPKVILRHGDGNYSVCDAEYLMSVAKAMEANGITELRTKPKGRRGKDELAVSPVMAQNADTTIVLMPIRGGNYEKVGRRDSSSLVFDATTGRIVIAPERTDDFGPFSEEKLDILRKSIESGRKDADARARKTQLFEVITNAWKKGEKDPATVYKAFNNEKTFDSISAENQKLFTEFLNAGSEDELAKKIAEYGASQLPDIAENLWLSKDPKEAAKIEKRIAAEDEIESRIMHGDEARAMLGIEPRKRETTKETPKAEKPEKPVAEKKAVEPAKSAEAKKSVTVESATPEDVAQIMADRYNQLHAKDANPQKAEPSRYMKTAELLLKNIRAKNADGLISTVANGLNPGSLRAFEVLTGIKMPRSQRDQRIAIDKYCGITPEDRAKIEADRKAEADAKAEAERRANALAEGERIAKETRVRLKSGEVTTAQKLLENGWTIKKSKRGAVTNLHLVAPDKSGYFRIDSKAFEYAEDFIAKRAKAAEKPAEPAEGQFLPGGVIEAHRALEGDNGKPPDGWRYLGTRGETFAVKVPDDKTLRDYIEKNFGKIEGDIESGVMAGGNLYNVNEILLKMAGAKSEVKPMHQSVRDASESTSITPQAKLDTYRDYAKAVISRDGATIADVRDAMYNVDVWPQGNIGETGVNAPDIFFNRLQVMMNDAFRADSRAQGIDAKYRKAESEGERQVLADQFRQYQRQFADNFLKTRRDEILKAFDEIELKPGETVEDAAKREAGVEQKSIGDEAKELADDVDAAIDAEEAEGGDPAAPANAPRGRGTGALPQDQPKSHGPGTKGRKIVTPQTFLRRAQELFPDVAFRRKNTVRMPNWAAAHFEPAARIIRAKDMNAIGDVSHELGHDIEHLTRYDVPKLPAVKRDLSDLGHQLYGPGTPKPPSYIGEGFAEYVRGYILNAPNLHQVAPDLDDWFNGAFKQKHPDIVKKLDELRDMVQTMKEQSAAQTVGGFMRPSTETITRAWKKTLDFFSGENWNDSASIILRGMKKSGIARIFHWQDDFRKLEASKNPVERRMLADMISDKIENNPYIFATITRGTASQRVMDMARHGTTSLLGNRKTGESLKDIFADFSPAEREDWKLYAVAKHGIVNYYDKGLDFGLPRDVLNDVVQQYESPKFQDALRRYTDYSHRILHLGVDAGLISQDTYDKIVADHPIYVRITRRYAQDGAGTRQGGQAINRRTGGFDHILDPIDAALMDQEKYLRACFQAKTLQLIIKAGERATAENVLSITTNGGPNRNNMNPQNEAHNAVGANWPVRVPNAQEAVKFSSGKLGQQLSKAAKDFAAATGADPIPLGDFVKDLTEDNTSLLTIFREKPSYGKHNLVSVYVDGELQTYELPDMRWANMLTDAYDKSEFNWFEKAAGIATAGVRLGATVLNPEFAIRNGIRDSLHSAVMSESGAVPGVSTLNGMLQQLLGSEAAELFRAMGGHMSDLVGVTKEQKWNHGGKVALAQNAFQTIRAYTRYDWALMKPVVKACADVLSLPELGPRVREMSGIMAKCRKAGLSDDACAILGMSHAKDISIDFQRAGRYMRRLNHFVPFINATWRGTEQFARNHGLLPALPHQFEDRNLHRAKNTALRSLAFVTSWVATLAMLEMSGDEKDRRKAFERTPEEKWDYEHIGDWRFPSPFEIGSVYGAIAKAVIYEMHGDKGAIAEALSRIPQATALKYLDLFETIGSSSLISGEFDIAANKDYRKRPIVPEHIRQNKIEKDWYTQYTTEFSKKLGELFNTSPALLEYRLDSASGGLYRRVALFADNANDWSRYEDWRNWPGIKTLKSRPQANRLISDFYDRNARSQQELGSGVISLPDFGRYKMSSEIEKQLTEKFDEIRTIRADKSIPLAEQDRRVDEVAEQANEIIRTFNARDDYRERGISYAASELTEVAPANLDDATKAKYLELLKGIERRDVEYALRSFGREIITTEQGGKTKRHRRWSIETTQKRIARLKMLLHD